MDDASLIAPDFWSGKRSYVMGQNNDDGNIIIFPPYKQFYCSERCLKIALFTSDLYFTEGVRFILESNKDTILYTHKDINKSYKNKHEELDFFIFHASSMSDVAVIYRALIKLMISGQKTIVLVIADQNVKSQLSNIANLYCCLKVISSRDAVSKINCEIKWLLDNRMVNKTMQLQKTLTKRQKEILLLVSDGYSAESIGIIKGVKAGTIYKTKARSLESFGATNKMLEAALYAQLKASPV
ncbi:hypothetical protein RM407_004397 [Enterobacter kobei]|nr:hypothetical protein [Enterobacter kobei]